MGGYLIEVRTGGELKTRLREIIADVEATFDLHGTAGSRPVPHITLYGPYDTSQGHAVKRQLQRTLSGYEVVPYRIDGFDTFLETDVIYANVVPSRRLRALRREIATTLAPLTQPQNQYDDDFYREFHITVANRGVRGQREAILEYLTETYTLQEDAYVERVTSLRRGEMLWEYDLLQQQALSPDEATSRESWERTTALLKERRSSADHDTMAPPQSGLRKWMEWSRAKLKGRW